MNFEKLYIFCKLETLFDLCFVLNYCCQASCKDLHWKTDFSLPFYAESWKMRKIPFLVTKSGQILNLMSGKIPRPQICGGFHLSESSSDGRNIPLELRFACPGSGRPGAPRGAWNPGRPGFFTCPGAPRGTGAPRGAPNSGYLRNKDRSFPYGNCQKTNPCASYVLFMSLSIR